MPLKLGALQPAGAPKCVQSTLSNLRVTFGDLLAHPEPLRTDDKCHIGCSVPKRFPNPKSYQFKRKKKKEGAGREGKNNTPKARGGKKPYKTTPKDDMICLGRDGPIY